MFSLRGKVLSYKLQLHANPAGGGGSIYFSVIIKGSGKESTFYLARNIGDTTVDHSPTGAPWAVRWGQVSQALIATLKDALVHGNDVTCVGTNEGWDGQMGPMGPLYNWLQSVEIHA
jgi:hypothetical protein